MNVIKYQLKNIEPLRIRDCNRGGENQIETFNYITGSAVRGFIINKIVEKNEKYFNENKANILSDNVKFYNAYPIIEGSFSVPSPKLYYAKKASPNNLMSVFEDLDLGTKRAKIGNFCTIENGKLNFVNVKIGAAMNNNVNYNKGDKKQVFRGQYISAGQEFGGYIVTENDELADMVIEILNTNEIRIGGAISKGYGLCKCLKADKKEYMPYSDYRCEPDNEMMLMLLSDTTMLNKCGEPCGLDLEYLSDLIGKFEVVGSAASVVNSQGHNNAWGCNVPVDVMYEKGSVFKLKFDKAPDAESINRLQNEGIGIRREEGFGHIVFTNRLTKTAVSKEIEIYNYSLTNSDELKSDDEEMLKKLAKVHYRQLIDRAIEKRFVNKAANNFAALSKSQAGDIKSIISVVKYLSSEETSRHIASYFSNKAEKKESVAIKYRDVSNYIKDILKCDLNLELNIPKKIFGLDTNQLLTSEETMWYKLDLIEKEISFTFREDD